MIIPSKFNVYSQFEDNCIIYNALSKKILFGKELNLQDYIGFREENTTIRKFLLDNYFLVSNNDDEKSLAKLIQLEEITKNDLEVMILPTTGCNLQCVYCYEKFESDYMSNQILQSIKLFFKRQISNYNRIKVEWFGGEPLLNKELVYDLSRYIISICGECRKPYTAGITTNCTLLDLETFNKLLDYHVNTFTITLDGFSDLHDVLKPQKNGKGSFEIILKNLMDIKGSSRNKYFTILIRINVTDMLLSYFDQFLLFLKNNFDDDSRTPSPT